MVEVILDKGDREDLRSLLLYLGETNLLPGIPQRVRDKLIERGWSAPEDSE